MSEPVTGHNTRKIDLLIQQGARIEATLASIDKRTDALDAHMDRLENRMLSLETRTAAVETRVGEMAGTLSTWNRVWAVGVPLVVSALIGTFYQGYDTKVSVVQAESRVAARIERLETKLSDVGEVKARLARLEGRFAAQSLKP